MADEKTLDRYMDKAASWLTDEDGVRLPKVAPDDEGKGAVEYAPEEYQKKQRELAQKLYDIDHNLGTPTPAPKQPGVSSPRRGSLGLPETQPAAPPVSQPPQMRSILEPQPVAAAQPVPMPLVGDGASQQQVASPSQNEWEGVVSGRKPYSPPERPLGSNGQPLTDMGPVPSQSSPQSAQSDAGKYPWLRPPGQLMKGTKANAGQISAPSIQPPKAPDFGALASSATDDTDRMVIGRLQSMYGNQPPEVQAAIGAFLNPRSDEEAAQAFAYLQQRGIDLRQMATPPKSNSVYPSTGLM